MTKINGMSQRIIDFVSAHPGCTRAELSAGLCVEDPHWGLPTYCRKQGKIFAAGPRSLTRYYSTAEQAALADESIRAEAKARRLAKISEAWDKRNAKLKELRKAKRAEVSARIKAKYRVMRELKASGVTIHPGVKITIAPPLKDRWA